MFSDNTLNLCYFLFLKIIIDINLKQTDLALRVLKKDNEAHIRLFQNTVELQWLEH